MNVYFCLIISALLSANLFAAGETPGFKNDLKIRLQQLKTEVTENLTKNLIPWWSARMVDNTNGGFYGRINWNDQVFPSADKGGILNARILWTYSAAYRVLKDTAYLSLATRAKTYIMDHFIDKESGGAYRSVKATGEVSDSKKQTYTEAFFIYGLTEYYRITGDQEALTTARNIFECLEKNAFDKESNGYFEVFTHDWKRSHEMLIGEKSPNDEKTMNTSLHVMEAYANLYRVWPDKRMADRLRNMVDLFLNKIVDKKSFHLICFMDKRWDSSSTTDSYGHDIEASWLIYEAANLLNDPALLARSRETTGRIAIAASEGLQPDGSMIDEKDNASGRLNSNRSWWSQAETVVGYLNAFELTGNEKYLDYSVKNWNYIKNHLIDNKNGGWYPSANEAGVAGKGDKAGFWTCPYHNGRMCLEIIERVGK
jgi:cellobiose epimerase